MPKAVIVGAGIGGLTTALRLAKRGYKVSIVEKYKQAGGRLNQIRKKGFVWDMGPSFLSMSYEFDEFNKDCKIDLPFEFVELDPLYAVSFKGDKKNYLVYKNIKKLAREFNHFEPKLEQKLIQYLGSAGKLFHDTENRIIRRNFRNRLHYLLTLTQIPIKHGPKLFNSFWKEMGNYFVSQEVKQALGLISFFLGETPYNIPAVFSLLSYNGLVHDGYYSVRGGMYQVVEGLLRELEKEGVDIQYNTEITGFIGSERKIYSLIDDTGEAYNADLYVINSDAAHFRGQVLKRKKFNDQHLKKMHWTLAPLTIYLGLTEKIEELQLHQFFLNDDFKAYNNKQYSVESFPMPACYYVNTPSKSHPGCAPEGCETVFIHCPVPNKINRSDWSDQDDIANKIIDDLADRLGIPLHEKIQEKVVMGPNEWEKGFNLYQGNGFGLAYDSNQIGRNRPPNFDEKFANLFYAGASTVPGSGLPMALISSKLVVERVVKRFGTHR